jgi:hypothetical protein
MISTNAIAQESVAPAPSAPQTDAHSSASNLQQMKDPYEEAKELGTERDSSPAIP